VKEQVIDRLARAYVSFLFVLEILLFSLSLLLHLGVVLSGRNEPYAHYAAILFRGAVMVGIPVTAFIRDGQWLQQVKSCPEWMWKGGLTTGGYSLFTACTLMLAGPPLSERAFTLSGFPLGFEAISLCILYSVLHSEYLEKSQVVRRALHSFVFVSIGIILFLASRAGYLPHPNAREH